MSPTEAGVLWFFTELKLKLIITDMIEQKIIDKYIERIKVDYPEDDKLMIDLIQFAEDVVKNCNTPDVSKSVEPVGEVTVCVALEKEGCYSKEVDMGCLECKYFR